MMKPDLLKIQSTRCRFFLLIISLIFLAILSGCTEEDEATLTGAFGPGEGGPAIDSSQSVTYTFINSQDVSLGILKFDSSYFQSLTLPVEGVYLTLSTPQPPVGSGINFIVSKIAGREDTACRFRAALMMRDEFYELSAFGERENDNLLEFYQVELMQEEIPVSLYCTIIKNNQGIMIIATAPTVETLQYQQTHFILNSIDSL